MIQCESEMKEVKVKTDWMINTDFHSVGANPELQNWKSTVFGLDQISNKDFTQTS